MEIPSLGGARAATECDGGKVIRKNVILKRGGLLRRMWGWMSSLVTMSVMRDFMTF